MLVRIKCVVCEAYFEPEEEYNIGDIISCPKCSNELKIISLDPPRVEIVEEEDLLGDFEDDIN